MRAGGRGRGGAAAPWPAIAAVALALAAPPSRAAAEGTSAPTFTFEQPPKSPKVEWRSKAQAGLASTTGNSRAISISAAASIARRSGQNELSADGSLALARSRVLVATERDGIPGIGPGELRSVDQTTTQAWSVGARYDRFFAYRNSVYASARAAADRPAGKALLAGGQIGYRRELFHADERVLSLEVGYDLTHQEYVAHGAPIEIHSGRLFLGWRAEPDPALGIEASVEALTNLGPESTPTGRVSPLRDDRIAALLAATVKVSNRGSVGLRLTAHYDTAPAPMPPPPGFSFEPGYVPRADRLDTRAELALVWQLL